MQKSALQRLIVPGTDESVVASYESLATRAQEAAFGLQEDEIVVLDIETTGFVPGKNEIIEIAAVICQGPKVLAEFDTFVRASARIPEEIAKLTGITDAMIADAPDIDTVLDDLFEFVGDRAIVAHNGSFDRTFIEYEAGGREFPGTWYDSLVLSRVALPRLMSHRLGDLSQAFCTEQADHRAISDVRALAQLWRVLLVALSDLPPGLLDSVISMHPQTTWPEREVLSMVSGLAPRKGFDLKAHRGEQVLADKADVRKDADEVELACPDPDRVEGEFSATGIAGAMYPGYEARDAQVRMAREVLAAFEGESHRAIEAGTGVGKSVAYLLPSALFAQGNDIGVGVATKTNALMDQLMYHELPKLKETLDGNLRYVALKGYEHYPCLRKAEQYAREDDTNSHGLMMIATLYAWIAQSSWGDLDTLNLFWRELPRDRIVATPAECNHRRCRFYPNLCYLHGVRRRAESSDIVVTNHALLFRDVIAQGGILPTLRHWIIDEAHSAEDEARKQLSRGVNYFDLTGTLDAIHSKRGSLTGSIRSKIKGLPGADMALGVLGKLETEIDRTRVIAESFFSFIKDLQSLAPKGEYDQIELWVNEEIRNSGPWGVVDTTGRSLAARLQDALKTSGKLVSLLEAFGQDASELRSNFSAYVIRLNDHYESLVTVLDGEDANLVYSALLNRRPESHQEALVASSIDIGQILVDDFYPRTKSVIYTSATIATADSFSFFARSVGFDRLPQEAWASLQLASGYDFQRHMQVYVPTTMPEPPGGAYLVALEELLYRVHIAMGGSTLTLFTNRRDMDAMYEKLRPKLAGEGLDLIAQTRGMSAKRIRDEFLADERLSLFALRSFWEGFDAPGDTLRCVVIPKLPFGKPTDPLSCERSLREGQAAWRKYALPAAVIDVKQAAGRLIRSSTDKGCLVLADGRILTKWYGTQFLSSLPSQSILQAPLDDIVSDIERQDF